jgi:drug/metabolite transporter (DMT)-like permease
MTPDSRTRPRLALIIIAFAVVYIVWGSTYLAIKYVVETMPPLLSAAVRFSLAGAAMCGWLQWRWPTPITLENWRAAGIVGTLLLLGGNGVVCWAQQHVPSGLTALIIGTTPLWFAVLEWLLFKGRRPTVRTVAGLCIGSAGICVLFGAGGLRQAGNAPVIPAIALLGACFSWALGSLYSKRAPLPKSVFLSTAMQMICGGLALGLVALLRGEAGSVRFEEFTARSWLSWGYLVIFGSLIAFTCYVWLLKHTAPTYVATYAYVNPIIAVLLGVLVAGETFSANSAIAAALIVAAVMLITTGGGKRIAVREVAPRAADEETAAAADRP